MSTEFRKKKARKNKNEDEEGREEVASIGIERAEEETVPMAAITKKRNVMDDRLGDLREELSTLPLGELLSLKDHMPAKLYKKAIFSRLNEDAGSSNDADADESGPNEIPESARADIGLETRLREQKTFKRDNRKRPRELSAKKPVSVIRDVFVTKKRVARDPRFDTAAGEYDSNVFRREYSFLNDMREEEYKALQKEIKNERDPKRLEKLRLLKQRMENQCKAAEEEDRKKEIKREMRMVNMERMKKGKQPFYVKKSELGRRLLDERFERLEKEGKLKKYKERQEKKLARKDKMPMT